LHRRLDRLHRDPRAQTDLGPLLPELIAESERLATARQRGLPQGLGHGDLFPDNLLFPRRLPPPIFTQQQRTPKSGGCILDLEQAATLPYAYDLAVALLAFCAPIAAADAEPADGAARLGPLRLVTAQALLAGYQSLRALGDSEWQGLYEELRFAALRFTITRLTDIHRYGQPSPPPPAGPVAIAQRPPLPKPLRYKTHSKDYRDFLQRWRDLGTIDSSTLVAALR
jgi:homoserine kinase type II